MPILHPNREIFPGFEKFLPPSHRRYGERIGFSRVRDMLLYDQQELFRVCPGQIRDAFSQLPAAKREVAEEIRLRQGYPATVLLQRREEPLTLGLRPVVVSTAMLEELLRKATDYSVYAASEYLRQGFVTIGGGHRIGFCGQAVLAGGQVQNLRAISSASIRIARPVPGYAKQLRPWMTQYLDSVLVIGPPGAGKTSLLREWTRLLSDEFGQRVSVVDERFEIAACRDGVALFPVGEKTDVLSGCGKAEGMEWVLRTMSPQWIVVDEITSARDIAQMQRAGYCGVQLAATAHAANRQELQSRSLYRALLSSEIFHSLLIIDANRQVHAERL